MHSPRRSAGILLSAIANARIRGVGMFLALLILSPGSHAALNEVNGNNPYTLSPAVSVGSYYDIVLQIKNNGSSLVNLTSVSTTGPFTLQWNNCGTSLAPGAGCSGNFGLRFTPTAVGPAAGTLVVGNDGPDGPFTLNLVATGSALLAPTVATSLSPSTIYTGTGVSALTWTVVNPNSVPVTASSFNVNLPAGIKTAANLNPSISCGNGTWYGAGAQSPANQSFVYFSANTGTRPEVPALGSCVMSIDISSPNAPGSYTLDIGQPIMFQEVWSALPTIAKLTVLAPVSGAPGAPAIVVVTRGNTQAAVTFTPPSDSGSSPITGYTVTSRPAGGVDSNAGSTNLTHIITGLVNGTAYTFTVSATNSAGTGAPSTPSSAVTPATGPDAPTNVIATAVDVQAVQAIVTFAAPASDGSSAITGYTVISSPAGAIDSNTGSTGRSHKMAGLVDGNNYSFTVVASNQIGTSPQSAPSNSITAGKIAVARPPIQTAHKIPTVRSNIPTKTWTIPPGPRVNSFEPAYLIPRSIEFADFNGDGFLDIIVAPSFPQHAPALPVAIWLNRGDGTFYDATSELIDGSPTLTWGAQQLLIGDFNNDGRPDVLFSSAGAEHAVEEGLSDSGYFNTLLLSQPNGKYKDATANININPRAFNHQNGMGDANGDGNLDFVVMAGNATIGGAQGVRLYYGDGQGNFVDATSALPQEIRNSVKTPGEGFQQAGCAGMADLDGDGKSEIITGSYSFGDRLADGSNGTRTVRFHKIGEDGKFTEVSRISIPDAISTIPYGYNPPPPVFAGLGCAQILAGDFNGDGRTDLLVNWEGNGAEYIQLLRNDGNFQFTDITVDALGSYQMSFADGSAQMGPAHFRLMDVNGDGTLDIVSQLGGTSIGAMQGHIAYLIDGTGHFTPWVPQGSSGALTSANFLSASKCASCSYLPLVFDTNKSGLASLVLLDFQSSVSTDSPSQTTAIYLTTFAPTMGAGAPVVEFYNTNLDNYFITADAGEATAIDSGSAGPGWTRTGNTFRSGGSTAVCRFYGSQSPGPNSHFYTVDPAECTSLKQLQAITPATEKRWNFESLDFDSTPPINGSCPSGTMAVYRAYNNGFTRGIDSNHRITRNITAIQQEVTRGWRNEGVVMCAPQ